MTWTGERIVADIRSAVFAHVIGLSPAFFETRHTGEITARLTSDVATLESVATSSVSIALRSLVTLVGCIILMFYNNTRLADLSFIAVPAIVFSAIAMGRTVQAYDCQAAVRDRYQATVAESFFAANAWDNIRIGRPNASDMAVRATVEAAHAAEFLDRLPDGFDTYLGRKGRHSVRRPKATHRHRPRHAT